MRIEDLNLSFIESIDLQQDIITYVTKEQKKLSEKNMLTTMTNPLEETVISPEDELLKDTLFFENSQENFSQETNSDTTENVIVEQNHILYHEDEFNDNEEDWAVSNHYDNDYIRDFEQNAFENHEDDINESLMESDAYTYPRDYDIYTNSYIGFVYIQSFTEKEFFLPCVLTQDAKIKYMPEYKNIWNDFYDYAELESWIHKNNLKKSELFIFTENSFFYHSLLKEHSVIFNSAEQIQNRLILKQSIEKDNNYFYLAQKYQADCVQTKSQKVKI